MRITGRGLRPFFSYYGGKWRAASKYPPPEHKTVIEPFAGSAGYAVYWHDRNIVLIDKNPIIANLWKYLIKVSPEEILALPDIPDGSSVDDFNLHQEARWLIGFWLNNGSASPRKSPSAWMRGRTRPDSFWGSAIRSRIASQLEHIRHWRVIEGDYTCAPEVCATWFVDPPYQSAGKYYTYKDVDYTELSYWCRNRPGFTMVCEAEGATWLPFAPLARIASSRSKHGKTFSYEALYTCRTDCPENEGKDSAGAGVPGGFE